MVFRTYVNQFGSAQSLCQFPSSWPLCWLSWILKSYDNLGSGKKNPGKSQTYQPGILDLQISMYYQGVFVLCFFCVSYDSDLFLYAFDAFDVPTHCHALAMELSYY